MEKIGPNNSKGIGRPYQKQTRIGLLIGLVVLISFSPLAFNTSFVWDDDIHLVDNELIKDVSFKNILRFWQGPYQGLYIPLSYTAWSLISKALSYGDSRSFDGKKARFFHIVNLVLHLLNTLTVYLILKVLVPQPLGAVSGALLFGIHPIQVESAAWISELRTLLCAFFGLSAIRMHIAFQEQVKKNRRPDRRARILYVGSTLCCILSLLAKPIGVVVPFFMLLINHFVLNRDIRSNIKHLIAWFLPAGLIAAIAVAVHPFAYDQFVPTPANRFFVAMDTSAFYLAKLFYPADLCVDYGRTPEIVLSRWQGYATWVLPAGLMCLLWLLRRTHKVYLGCFLLFLVGFGPVSGLFPFVFQAVSTTADRYLYFPMIGVAVAFGTALGHDKKNTPFFLLICLVLLLMVATFRQTRYWENETRLFTHAYAVNPQSYMSLNNLAAGLKVVSKKRLALYLAAVSIKPDHLDALTNLASSLLALKKSAPRLWLPSMIRQPHRMKAEKPLCLGTAYAKERSYKQALYYLGRAAYYDMAHPGIHANIAGVLIAGKKFKEANVHLDLAETLSSKSPETLNNRGIVEFNNHRVEAARALFKRARRLQPDSRVIRANLTQVEHDLKRPLEPAKALIPLFQNHCR